MLKGCGPHSPSRRRSWAEHSEEFKRIAETLDAQNKP